MGHKQVHVDGGGSLVLAWKPRLLALGPDQKCEGVQVTVLAARPPFQAPLPISSRPSCANAPILTLA